MAVSTDSLKYHNPVQSICFIIIDFIDYAGNLCLLCWHYAECLATYYAAGIYNHSRNMEQYRNSVLT